jgi:redox-sensitive bicupin YhaK (pirin superfamily)
VQNRDSREVVAIVRGRSTQDGAGVRLTRIIGTPDLDSLDPFLLLDEFRSDDPSDYIAGFPDHPHRGFETVTYMLAGRMRHADNQGNRGSLGPGSVQWMTAAHGIVHSELPEQQDGLLWGFQLWVNLPAADKMGPPRYQDIEAEAIPETVPARGARARVIAGRLGDVEGPVSAVATKPLYVDLHLQEGASCRVEVPEPHNAFVYAYDGGGSVGSPERAKRLERGQLGVLGPGPGVRVEAESSGCRLLLVAGQPLREPVARYGPFVMNTDAELRQAFADYQAGRL